DPATVRAMHEPRLGLSLARNRGLGEARGPIVAYLDDDAVPRPGWLAALLAPYRDPHVVAVGGRIVLRFPGPPPPRPSRPAPPAPPPAAPATARRRTPSAPTSPSAPPPRVTLAASRPPWGCTAAARRCTRRPISAIGSSTRAGSCGTRPTPSSTITS